MAVNCTCEECGCHWIGDPDEELCPECGSDEIDWYSSGDEVP